MDFRVLGPLEVRANGRSLDLGPLKQRSLLALLLIHANAVVSTDRILDELWGEEAHGKENALWVYVSRLRSVLEPERTERGESTILLRKDRGYVLAVGPDEVDAVRFENKMAEGRSQLGIDPEAASKILSEALEMWRGAPLEDFAYESFARGEIARLEELRLEALESRIEADLISGNTDVLVAELEGLVRDNPLRERLTGQLMMALYRSGRQAEALRVYQETRRRLGDELGIEPSHELRRLEEQILLQDPSLRPEEPERDLGPNPYKGLRAFFEADADDFFGRDELTAELVAAVAGEQRLTAVVGPSGSGKSSAVRAGLIPELRAGAISGSDRWLIAQMFPGAHPFTELEMALLREAEDPPASLAEHLSSGSEGLLRAVLRVLPDEDSQLVLLIDQFEELFTLVADEPERKHFMENLITAVEDPRGRVRVVVTLRADFYDRPLLYPGFGPLFTSNIVNVLPLTTEELETAAIEPARRSGVQLGPSLLAELVADFINQPGALPLFQYTLTDLFEGRSGGSLTLPDYRAIGGLRGSLTGRADQLYLALDEEQQQAATQLFLRLVSVSEGREDSRRRVAASELTSLDVDTVAMQAVLEAFGSHRLLSFDRDPTTGVPTVEVAHEALLREWARLRDWIAESREDIQRHATFAVAVQEWLAADRDPDYLVAGTRLEFYEQWRIETSLQLTRTENAYLDAAIERREAIATVEEERSADQAKLKRRARSRLWGLAAAVMTLAIVGGVLLAGALLRGPTIALFSFPAEENSLEVFMREGLEDAHRDFTFVSEDIEVFANPDDELWRLSESGPDLIVTTVLLGGSLDEVAPEFPEVSYVVMDTPTLSPTGPPNVGFIAFAVEEGAFLVGAAAALESQTGTIGYFGGVSYLEFIEAFRAGYEAGAKAAVPDINVLSVYPNAGGFDVFIRPDLGRQAGEFLYRREADVVFHAAGGSGFGVAEVATELEAELDRKLWYIGVDADEFLTQPDRIKPVILTSMIKRFDLGVYTAIDVFVNEGIWSEVLTLDLAAGGVGFSESGGFLSPATVEAVNDFKRRIISGEIQVSPIPSGPGLLTLPPLPPPGFEATHTARVIWDGEDCRYQGDTSFRAFSQLQVEFANLTADQVALVVYNVDLDRPAVMAIVDPGGEVTAYAILEAGTNEVNCILDLSDFDPRITAVELTVGG